MKCSDCDSTHVHQELSRNPNTGEIYEITAEWCHDCECEVNLVGTSDRLLEALAQDDIVESVCNQYPDSVIRSSCALITDCERAGLDLESISASDLLTSLLAGGNDV